MALALTPELTFLIGLVIFWVVLYLLAYIFHLNKHGLDVKPAYFMYKSKSLNSFLDKLAGRWRMGWKTLSNIGLAFSIGLMIFSVYLLANNLLRFFIPIGEAAPVFPVIVGLTIRLYWLPYFFAAVGIVFLTHELAHGVIARLENIPVLSAGVFAVLVFFGAFVEQDDKEFEKAPLLARLRMLAVASSTNLMTALLVFVLLSGLFAPPSGVLIHEVAADGPVAEVGLQNWDVIYAINGTQLLTHIDFFEYMENVGPNVTLTLTVLHANMNITKTIVTEPSVNNQSRGIIGVFQVSSYRPSRLGLDQYSGINLYWTIFWVYILALNVAIFNMFPLYPFDGERVLYYPLERLAKKHKRELRVTLNAIALGLLAGNMILTFWNFGLLSI